LVARPRPLEVLDFEVLRFAWARLPVRLLAADFRVDLRVEAAEELVLLLLGSFAFPLLVVFPRLVVVRVSRETLGANWNACILRPVIWPNATWRTGHGGKGNSTPR
jgi:hypothetical protein